MCSSKEQQIATIQEQFAADVESLERACAARINAEIARVAAIISPLPVGARWIASLAEPSHPIQAELQAAIEARAEQAFREIDEICSKP